MTSTSWIPSFSILGWRGQPDVKPYFFIKVSPTRRKCILYQGDDEFIFDAWKSPSASHKNDASLKLSCLTCREIGYHSTLWYQMIRLEMSLVKPYNRPTLPHQPCFGRWCHIDFHEKVEGTHSATCKKVVAGRRRCWGLSRHVRGFQTYELEHSSWFILCSTYIVALKWFEYSCLNDLSTLNSAGVFSEHLRWDGYGLETIQILWSKYFWVMLHVILHDKQEENVRFKLNRISTGVVLDSCLHCRVGQEQTGQQHESWYQPSEIKSSEWSRLNGGCKLHKLLRIQPKWSSIQFIKSLFKSGIFPFWVQTESAKSFALVYFATFREESWNLHVVLQYVVV